MKRFLIKLGVFSLPVLLGLLAIWLVKPDAAFRFHYIKGDCSGRADWMRQRIDAEQPIDLLFLGSSRTMNAVNDRLLDSLLKAAGRDWQVVNFGYCRLGRDLQLVLLEEVLEKHQPKAVVLEVREQEGRHSHPMYPFLADRQSVLNAPMRGNKAYFDNLQQNWLLHLMYLQHYLLQRFEQPQENRQAFGFHENRHLADPGFLREKRSKVKYQSPARSLPRFSEYYLEQIVERCNTMNLELLFLYISENGSKNVMSAQEAYYITKGHLLSPPPSLINTDGFWMDNLHLNEFGAAVFTNWLFERLNSIQIDALNPRK